jgi:hypothetical protein
VWDRAVDLAELYEERTVTTVRAVLLEPAATASADYRQS